jgi:hypothetical protein
MLLRATDWQYNMLTLFLLFLALAMALYRPIAISIPKDIWTGVNSLWAFVPLGVLVFWQLLRANYDRYSQTERQRDSAMAKLARLKDIKHQLSRLIVDGQRQVDDVYVGIKGQEDISKNIAMFMDWVAKVREFLQANIPEKVQTFDQELTEGGMSYALKRKIQFRVDRLRYIQEWFDAAPS